MNTPTRLLRRSLPSALALLASLLLALGPTQASADVVARIGGTDVSTDELRAYLESLGAADRAALARDPAALAQLVRAYLARYAVLKEAKAKKWDQRPEVKLVLEKAREQALSESYLLAQTRPPDVYPSQAEVQAAYDANKKAFEVPPQYRLAQLFIEAGKGAGAAAEEKARAKLDAVLKKLKEKGADFSAIARTDSDEPSAAERGGEVGWLTEAQLVPGIRGAVLALKAGGTSEPLRLDDGWHLLKVLETRPATTRTLAEAREVLVAQLRADRAMTNRQAFLTKLLEQNPPAINELELSKLLPKDGRPAPTPAAPAAP
jgi:peptidylprolyl isomerase